MKILAITNLYPRPGREGLAPFNRQQFAALAAAGHELAVVSPAPWPEALAARLRGRAIPGGPYDRRDGVTAAHPTYFYPPRVLQHRYGDFFLASVRKASREMARDLGPQVVLGSWAHPDGWAATRLARDLGVPCVVKVVGSDVLVAGKGGSRRRVVAEALQAADVVVAVSRDLAAHVEALGVEPGRIRVVPEGLDTGRFRPGDRAEARARLGLDPSGPLVLFVGNLLRSKGAGVLVEAFAAVAHARPDARCALVGSGRDARRIAATVARLGLADRVLLAGSQPHGELPDWYAACDALALPSFSEGIPNVLREAAACGRPYVATRVGGIPELADPACPLVPPGDPTALAEALLGVLATAPDPAGLAVRAAARNASWDDSAGLLADVLQDAIRKHAGAAHAPDRPLQAEAR